MKSIRSDAIGVADDQQELSVFAWSDAVARVTAGRDALRSSSRPSQGQPINAIGSVQALVRVETDVKLVFENFRSGRK